MSLVIQEGGANVPFKKIVYIIFSYGRLQYAAQAGLKLRSSCFSLLSAKIASRGHQAQLLRLREHDG